jgi:hypothetical protein
MHSDDRLRELQQGLGTALSNVQETYGDLHQAAEWLEKIAELLDPDGKSERTGERRYVNNCLTIWMRFRSREQTIPCCLALPPILSRQPKTMPPDYFIHTTLRTCLAPIMIENVNSGELFSRYPERQVRKGQLVGSFCVQEPGR